MSIVDSDKVARVMRQASQEFILPRYKALQDHEIDTKSSPTDLVTLADIEAEAYLEKVLPDILPGSIVIGEEGVSRGHHDMKSLSMNSGQDVWVVDPVDGTHNFVHGRKEFGVMVALVSNGVCVAGWIYDVLQDSMAHAFLGEGAFIDNSAHLTPKVTKSFDEMIVHLSPKFFPADIKAEMKVKSAKLPNVYTVGCSAHEYMNVAKGRSDSIVYCRLMPWDHLAGSLIVQEAGGVVSKWDSIPYRPQDLYDGLIIARSKDGWQKVYDKFFADMDMDSYMQARRDKLRRQGKI